MNQSAFPYDLFLSPGAKDQTVVRPLAERLRQDGLKVWFKEVRNPNPEIRNKSERPNEECSKPVALTARASFPIAEFVLVSEFGIRICAARPVGPGVRIGPGAI
jgi:hypothetical protein